MSKLRFRMDVMLYVGVLLLGAIFFLAPTQFPVALYKIAMVANSAVLGYWIDRQLFPYARPDEMIYEPRMFNAATLRRAIIVGSCMLAVALAL